MCSRPISAAFSSCSGRGAEHVGQTGGGHGAGRTDFALAADFGAGDRGVFLAEDADGSGAQKERHDVIVRRIGVEFHVVVQHRRNDPRRAVGRRGDHAPAGGVFFVHGEGEQVDPFHGRQGRGDDIRLADFLQAAVQFRRAARHIQAAGQDAFVAQALLDALAHHRPDMQQALADFCVTAPGPFVGHHQLGNPQAMLVAQLEQFGGAGKIVRQHHIAGRRDAGLGFGRFDDETAADRVVRLL